MQKKRALLKSLTRAVRVATGAGVRAVAQMEKKAAVYFSKSWLEKMESWLWRFSRPTLEKLLQHEEKRISDASRATAAERRRTEALRLAAKHFGDRDWQWRYWCLRLRRTGALQDGGPTSFFELWRTLPPERLARAEDEAEARRRAEASFITHLQAIAHGRTGLSVSALRQPMPSDPARAADDEAVLRMLWLWVGYVAYDETLSESGEEAVKRFLKRAWPKYHGSRITRSLLETWVQYAKDIKYERDAQACYGGRGWDPRRRR